MILVQKSCPSMASPSSASTLSIGASPLIVNGKDIHSPKMLERSVEDEEQQNTESDDIFLQP